jgi:purine-binding chemotaxis protein CheW
MATETSQTGGRWRSLVVFAIDGQRYALPLDSVERVVPRVAVTPLPDAPAIALGVINLHGAIVPAVDIRQRFGSPPVPTGLDGYLLVVCTTRRRLAFPIDEIHGVTEVESSAVVAPATLLPGIGHVAGLVALPDGLLLIQDLEQLLGLDEERALDRALEAAHA